MGLMVAVVICGLSTGCAGRKLTTLGEGPILYELCDQAPKVITPLKAAYPEGLKAKEVSGEVVFQVEIRPDGEPGQLRIIKSDHVQLTDAVQEAAPAMRFDALPQSCAQRKRRREVRMTYKFVAPEPAVEGA